MALSRAQLALLTELANMSGELSSRREAYFEMNEATKTLVKESRAKGLPEEFIILLVGDDIGTI